MNANAPLTADVQKKDDNRRKRKALLAGGVVLGIGAAVTLAAWSDDVFADGVFNTGSFNMEGNASIAMDEAEWHEHNSATGDGNDAPAALTFRQSLSTADAPTTLQYNETVWAPFSVRLDEDTDTPGSYELISATFGGEESALTTGSALDYTVLTGVSAADCAAAPASGVPADGEVWYSQSPVGAMASPAPDARDLSPGADASAGSPDNMCLGVTLTSNSQDYMGAAPVSVLWQFTATADTE